MNRNWIVVSGTIVNTVNGGGFEFIGPFTEREAKDYLAQHKSDDEDLWVAIELLSPGRPT